ncbi:MAG: hypothetical protein F4Z87_07240 [Gammaproteobacteria bacterium]|nr:hypothetical protein [Gammaproteobacteria bacterium]
MPSQQFFRTAVQPIPTLALIIQGEGETVLDSLDLIIGHDAIILKSERNRARYTHAQIPGHREPELVRAVHQASRLILNRLLASLDIPPHQFAQAYKLHRHRTLLQCSHPIKIM